MTDHTEELQQRLAALEAENERLESLISGARRVTSAVIEERDSFQREGIRAMERLETARGLLERITAAHDCTALNEARAFLAATPAQEVRQEAVAWTWEGCLHDLKSGREVTVYPHKGQGVPIPLYTTPHPAPDVRALVEAVKGVKLTPSDMRHWGRGSVWWNNAVEACLDAIKDAHRQAQQG
jgi:hypothetical protein